MANYKFDGEFPSTGTMEGDIKAGLIVDGVYQPKAITPETLSPQSPLDIKGTTSTPYNVSALEVPSVPQMTATPQEEKMSGISDQLQSLYGSLRGQSAYQSEQERRFGVDTISQNINDLTSQLTRLKNEAAAIPLALDKKIEEGGTILGSAYTTEQNKRARDNAVAALGVSTLLAASQGQLANAQALADRAVAEKYNPVLEEIGILKENLEIIKNDPRTSIQDQNRAQAQIDAQNERERQIEQQMSDQKVIFDIATQAATNGRAFTPVPGYQTLSSTLMSIANADSREEALQIASATGLLGASDNFNVVGSATTGYYSFDPVTGKATRIISPTSSGNTPTSPDLIKITAEDKRTLIGAGFTTGDIANIENDVSQYGIEAVLNKPDLTSAQRAAIAKVYNATVQQEIQQGDIKQGILEYINGLKATGYKRAEAERTVKDLYASKDYLNVKSTSDLPKVYKNYIEDALVEAYGKTFWQRIIPGGR